MDPINKIVEIIIAQKVIVTWIVIGWLLLFFVIIKPMHGWGKWRDIVRGIGEGTLGSAWAILCGALFHPIPGLSIMMFIAFGAFHWIRSWIDRLGAVQSARRTKLRWAYFFFYAISIWSINWYFEYDVLHDAKRGIAQLTSNTVFASAGKSCKHWFACDCAYPLHGTGIRPSEPQATAADSSSFLTKLLDKADSEK